MEDPKQRPRGLIGPFTARQIGVFNAVVLAVALGLLLITRPLEPSYVAPSFAPGATFFQIGAATQGLKAGERIPDFAGTDGGHRSAVILNAAGGIAAAGHAEDLREGIAQAREAIDSGAAAARLDELVEFSRQ